MKLLMLALLLLARLADVTTAAEPVDHMPEQQMDTVTVTAEKRPAALQDVPASVTVVGETTIANSGIDKVRQAAQAVPNLFVSEFTAQKLSFPFVRGVGGGSLNPAVTTYYDGVPQLNANASSIELLDIERIEFLRGPQGTLYGRNTLGGVINVVSRTPSFDFGAQGSATFGNYDLHDYRATVSGERHTIQPIL